MFRRLAVIVACAIALTLALPLAANAASRTYGDGTGDVWALDSPEDGRHTRAPERRHGDIVRTTFQHRQRRVVIRTRFAELGRQSGRYVVAVRLRTEQHLVRWVRLSAGPGENTWRGRTQTFQRDNGTSVDCATTHSLDYTDNTVVVQIPRTCLGDPRWVQGTQGVATFSGRQVFTDNPVDDGPTAHLRGYSPRIRRG
jgi:hypothetical protein